MYIDIRAIPLRRLESRTHRQARRGSGRRRIRHPQRPASVSSKNYGKFIVFGPSRSGRILQVAFVIRTADQVDPASLDLAMMEQYENWADVELPYIIHAMPAPDPKKKHYQRRSR
jgi:hypothetical protein